jgi:antitoxin component YwqK of YwqJK toxin-antitoxin module
MTTTKKILFGGLTLAVIILIMNFFNLFGQNKPKDDPYWEFDKAKHFRPKLNKGDFFKLTGFDFGWFVLKPISEYIQDREGELTRGNTLSYGQKALYYWWYVDAQVTNGGFAQFYYNDYGMYVPTIIKGLKHIGDNKMAELVNRSYDLCLKENKKIKDARQGGLEAFSNLYKEIKDFDELDDEYYKLNEQTMKNIENYIRKNPNEFCLDEEGKEFDLSFDGDLKTFYSSNKPKEVIPISNGVVSGAYRSYYENGNLKEIIQYLNGEQEGERIEYFENGNKKFAISKSDKPKGYLHSHFFENGNLKSTEIYISKHDRDGKWIQYYPNGQMKSETEFIQGEFLVQNCWKDDGTQIMKDGTGLYINEYSILDGVIDRNEQEYKNYKRHGKQYSYSNNKLTLYQEMVNGKEHGVTRTYDESGNVKEETIYENGKEISRTKMK